MKHLLLCLFLVLTFQGFSQYSLKGVLKSYSLSRIIGFANVVADTSYNTYFKNRKFLGGTTSNEEGEFEIHDISKNKVNLSITYIGFGNLIVENITLKKDEINDLGTIYLFASASAAGMELKDGDIKNPHKKLNKKFKIRYPKKGKKLEVIIKQGKQGYKLINYEDLVNWQNK